MALRLALMCLLWSTAFSKRDKYASSIEDNTKKCFNSLSLQNFSINYEYPYEDSCASTLSVAKVTSSNESYIHRFFDSSPISPSGRYIAVTRIPERLPYSEDATVCVIDLLNGETVFEYPTKAWDSQVGSHVQWGASDHQLFFNVIATDFRGKLRVHGIVLDVIGTKNKKHSYLDLKCPVYHVSMDGERSVSPSLQKIKYTQRGYGVELPDVHPNTNSLKIQQDGIFISSTFTGDCVLLVSLATLAKVAGLPYDGTIPLYGFHTKWSSDGQWILVIMRSMELSHTSWKYLKGSRVRRQHLFAVSSNTNKSVEIKYLLSWSSKPFYSQVLKKIIVENDANHPNWIPNSHSVSINIDSRVYSSALCKWSLGVLNIHDWSSAIVINNSVQIQSQKSESIHNIREVFKCSSGHPAFKTGGRYALVDAYSKEAYWFKGVSSHGVVPLRLFDIFLNKSYILLEIQVERANELTTFSKIKELLRFGQDKRGGDVWRCDMHPAWSRDYSQFAFNGRPDGKNRQVFVARINHEFKE